MWVRLDSRYTAGSTTIVLTSCTGGLKNLLWQNTSMAMDIQICCIYISIIIDSLSCGGSAPHVYSFEGKCHPCHASSATYFLENTIAIHCITDIIN